MKQLVGRPRLTPNERIFSADKRLLLEECDAEIGRAYQSFGKALENIREGMASLESVTRKIEAIRKPFEA